MGKPSPKAADRRKGISWTLGYSRQLKKGLSNFQEICSDHMGFIPKAAEGSERQPPTIAQRCHCALPQSNETEMYLGYKSLSPLAVVR